MQKFKMQTICKYLDSIVIDHRYQLSTIVKTKELITLYLPLSISLKFLFR